MSTTLELKQRIRAMDDRLIRLEQQVEGMILSNLAPKLAETTKRLEARKLCPHCGEVPAYFFHVRSCGKKQEKDDDRIRDPGST